MDLDLSQLGKSTALPPYRAVLAVDMENFSSTSALNQQTIGVLIPQVLQGAFALSDLTHVWDDARFARHSGDGYVLGAEPRLLPYLVSPFLQSLQDVLRGFQPRLAAINRELRMRFRVSIGVGPLPDTGDGSGIDAMGEAMISTHRLLDSAPVRRELKETDPDTTLVAAIVSRRVYEDVVLGGFTSVPATRWKPVQADLPDKKFRAEGYLFVPTPSREPTREELADEPEPTGESADGAAARTGTAPDASGPHTGNSVGTNNAGQVIQAGTLHGGISFKGDSTHGD